MLELVDNHMPRGIPMNNLCKHMFICGVPGSGKTTAVLSVLIQLSDRGIPFLVIEAAKKEYRVLKTLRGCGEPAVADLAEKIQLYTPGSERLSPVRFNPLWRPRGVDPDEHVDMILRCFKAAMPMFEPLPAILAEAVELAYEEHPDDAEPPTMDDLFSRAQRTLEQKRYSADTTSNLRGALDVRLGMLTRRAVGRTLRSSACMPDIERLIKSHSIIELDTLETEVKCLFTLFLLTAIHQHIRAHPEHVPTNGADPRLVIVIEEAHNIVGRSTNVPTGEDQVDPKAYATELICRMLAEFRALGVGLILADQLPSEVAPQVIKNTGTKLAFRQVDREDRETLADATLFGNLEYEEIARLLPGQAYLYAEGYHRAHRIRTPNLAQQLKLPRPPDEEQLVALIRDEPWFQETETRRISDVLFRFGCAMGRYDRQWQRIRQRLEEVLQRQTELAETRDAATRQRIGHELAATVQQLGKELLAACARLERGPYAEAQRLDISAGESASQLSALRESLIRKFEEGIQPQAERTTEFIDRKVAQLQRGVFQKEE